MIALHDHDGAITLVSQSATSLTGWSSEALQGRPISDLIVPDDRRHALGALAETFCHGRKARTQCRIRRADGAIIWVEVTASAAPDGQVSTVMRDVSASHAHELAQFEARTKAENAANARAAYLADLSHEIRTPLNAVIGFADMMRAETFGPLGHAKYDEYAGLIYKSGEHLLSLVSDLLDISKIEAGKYVIATDPALMAELTDDCVSMMRLSAEEAGLWIKADTDDDGVSIMVDTKIIRQILLNLLSNAVKFTKQGGITVRLRQDERNVWVSVIDTGIGMSREDLARVGERFEQVHREGVRGAKGTGLGLALSDALARLHGGELRLASTLDEGTSAVLRLPREIADVQPEPVFDNEREDPAFRALANQVNAGLKQA